MKLNTFSILFALTLAIDCFCIPLGEFYPFGLNVGDKKLPVNDDGSSPRVTISSLFPFFNNQHNSLFVNTNGAISFNRLLKTYTPSPFPLDGGRHIIAPFWADVDIRNGGNVYYRETTNRILLDRASNEVKKFFPPQIKFQATWIFIATWDNVAFYGANSVGKSKRNTFQVVLVTNGRYSFTFMMFNKVQWTTGTASQGDATTGLGGTPAQVGFNAGDGINYFALNASRSPDIINVPSMSNVDTPGKFVFRIDAEKIENGASNIGASTTPGSSSGSSGTPIPKPHQDGSWNFTVTPGQDGTGSPTGHQPQEATGAPTTTPSNCTLKWSSWINKDTPSTDDMEREFMTPDEKTKFCGDGEIKRIECYTSDGRDIPYNSSGEIGTTCDVPTGLTCMNNNNFPLSCNDYKIRYFCECAASLPVTPTHSGINPTEAPVTKSNNFPASTTPGPSSGSSGTPIPKLHQDGNGNFTVTPGQGGTRIPTAHQPQEATSAPTTAPSNCTLKWSSWINKDTPSTDDMEREFMTPDEKTKFCGDGDIKKIECVTSDGRDIPYYSSGELGTTCDVTTGLTCMNDNNFPLSCNDYKIRYFCECAASPFVTPTHRGVSPTAAPVTKSNNFPGIPEIWLIVIAVGGTITLIVTAFAIGVRNLKKDSAVGFEDEFGFKNQMKQTCDKVRSTKFKR